MTREPTNNIADRLSCGPAEREITQHMLLLSRQCVKRPWLEVHRPHLRQSSIRNRSDIETANTLRRLVRQHYGSHAAKRVNTSGTISRSSRHNSPARPLFDATFRHDNIRVRTDILAPLADGWRLVSVKSSASVKKQHLAGIAIQAYVLKHNGMEPVEICIAHVDTGFQYGTEGDYSGLMLEKDVTSAVQSLLPAVPGWIASCQDALSGREPPGRMGAGCKTPMCEFMDYCSQSQPAFPLSMLPNGGKVIEEFLADGIEDLREVSHSRLKSIRHLRVWNASRTGQAFASPELGKKLAALAYPRFYLDFETINFAIPRWIGVRPHRHVPFQWSCHIERPNGTLVHREFLDTDGISPMRAFAESLLAVTRREGPVIVYGRLEGQVLEKLLEHCPELQEPIENLRGRLVDILPWLQEYYYHPDMKGSWSIKKILPTVAPHLSYHTLENVRNGSEAQAAYLDIIDGGTEPDARALKIANLLEYCKLDTMALVEIVRFFQQPCPIDPCSPKCAAG